MINIYSEVLTILTSLVGVYELIRFFWEEAEKAQFGKYVVSNADTFVCFVLSLIIVIALTVFRLAYDE